MYFFNVEGKIKEIIYFVAILSLSYVIFLVNSLFIGLAFLSILVLMFYTFLLYISLFRINHFHLIDWIFFFLFMDILWISNFILVSFFYSGFYLKIGFGSTLYLISTISIVVSILLRNWSAKNIFSDIYRVFKNKVNLVAMFIPLLVLAFYWFMRVLVFPRYPSPDEYCYVELARQMIQGMPPAPFYVVRGVISQALLGRYLWITNIALGLTFDYLFLPVDISLLLIYVLAQYLLCQLKIENSLMRILLSAIMMIVPGVYVLSFLLLPDLFLHTYALAGVVLFGHNVSKIEERETVTMKNVISLVCIFFYASLFTLLVKNNLGIPLVYYLMFLRSLNRLKSRNSIAKKLLIIFIIIPLIYELFIDMPVAVFQYILKREAPKFLSDIRIINIAGFFILLITQTEFTRPLTSMSVYNILSEFLFVFSPNRLSAIIYLFSLAYAFLFIIRKISDDNVTLRFLIETFILYLIFSTLYFSVLRYSTLGWDESRNSLILDMIAYILSIAFLDNLINSEKCSFSCIILSSLFVVFNIVLLMVFSFIELDEKLMYAGSMLSIFGIKADFKGILLLSIFLVIMILIASIFLRCALKFGRTNNRIKIMKQIFLIAFILFIVVHSVLIIYIYHTDNYVILEDYDIQQVKNFINELDTGIIISNIYAIQGLNENKAIISFPMSYDEFIRLLRINISFSIIYDDRPIPTWTSYIFGLNELLNRSLEAINWKKIQTIRITPDVHAFLIEGDKPSISSMAQLISAFFYYAEKLLAYMKLEIYCKESMNIYVIVSSICCSRVYLFNCKEGLNSFIINFPRWIKVGSRYRFYGPYFQRETMLLVLEEKGDIIYRGYLNTNSNESSWRMRVALLILFLILIFLFVATMCYSSYRFE